MQANRNWRGLATYWPHVSIHHRAYSTLREGVADYARVVTQAPSYAVHTAALLAGTIDEAEWWRRLLLAGYGTHVPNDADMQAHRSIVAQYAREFPG